MSSNSEFQTVGDLGWQQGFANLFRKENHLWWRTSRWWVQILLWLAIANGILFLVIGMAPKMEKSYGQDTTVQTTPQADLDIYGLTVFLKMAGIMISIGVVILGQGTMIDEKQVGTAAWVLSKPISRSAFILSKVISNSMGVLMTMAVVQGCVAYWIIYFITGKALPVLPFAEATGLLFLNLSFWLTMTIMLSTITNLRGLVIGVPLILLLGYTLFVEIAPWLADFMPWNLTGAVSENRPALAVSLVTGQPLPTIMPVIASLVWCVLFTMIAIWRFRKEEF
jgi:ABC-2 type transport system permease protein